MIQLPPLSLYVHIPWCVQKCPYCDFNSHALNATIPEQRYIEALLEDLETDIANYHLQDASRPLHSIFIGGGTPSLLSAQGIQNLISGIKARIPFKSNIEITMEANPNTVESERFKGYHAAGVTRISIGVQSFEQQKLSALGRIHNQEEAINAVKLAQQTGFSSLNIDLMHGLPNQSIEQALNDLEKAIELNPTHLSWYQLTIEPNTQFHFKPPTLPDDDALWDIFELGHQKLIQAGYVQYETSGYCKPGYSCQHNLNYWRFGDYLGIGCGAHGKLSFNDGRIIRTTKVKHPRGYLDASVPYLNDSLNVSEIERPFEFFMNRFRLLEPCPKNNFIHTTGLSLNAINTTIAWALEQDYVSETSTHWQVTEKGKLFLNDLLAAFMFDEEN